MSEIRKKRVSKYQFSGLYQNDPKEYFKEYYQALLRDIVKCETCQIDMCKLSMKKHVKSKGHSRRLSETI